MLFDIYWRQYHIRSEVNHLISYWNKTVGCVCTILLTYQKE